MPTVFSGQAIFNGQGNLSPLAIKPPNRIVARLAGHSSVTIITIAPHLVASARFIGFGAFVFRPNSQSEVLSTANSVRMSFPTFPNPSDPFTRRPSKNYNNYSISVRFTGSGRITAIAS